MGQFLLRQKVIHTLVMGLAILGCHRHPQTFPSSDPVLHSKDKFMDMDPKSFLSVQLNVDGKNICSPTNPGTGEWRGILIQAPRQVRFKKNQVVSGYRAFAAIPICGYRLIPLRVDLLPEPLRIIAVDTKTRLAYEGPIVDLDPDPEIPMPDRWTPTPKDVEGMASGGYFNPNLADFVKIPIASATYDVHIEFREFKSNIVTIELILEED